MYIMAYLEGDSNYRIKSVSMNVGVFITQLLGRGSKVFSE